MRKHWILCLVVISALAAPSAASAGSAHVGQAITGRPSHIEFYEKMMARYEKDPAGFSQRHRLMARSIHSPKFLENMTARLLSHPSRFIKYHHCFSKFLDGKLQKIQLQSPTGTSPGPGLASQNLTGENQNGSGGSTPGTPTGASAVPEPSSWVLLAIASLGGGFLHYRNRFRPAVGLVAEES